MADPRHAPLTPEEQQIAAELMAAVDDGKLGGGEAVLDRAQAPQRDDIDPGTLLSTVHAGSHTPGAAIGAAPAAAEALSEHEPGDGDTIEDRRGSERLADLIRGELESGRPDSHRGGEDALPRGSGDPSTTRPDPEDPGQPDPFLAAERAQGAGVDLGSPDDGGSDAETVPSGALDSTPAAAGSGGGPGHLDGPVVAGPPGDRASDPELSDAAGGPVDEQGLPGQTIGGDDGGDAQPDHADAPTLSVSDAAGGEDSAIALDLSAELTDAGETLSVTISGVPTGASLSAGTDNGDGTWTLTQGQLSGLTITPPPDSNVDFSLTVTATSTDGTDTASTTGTVDVTVDAVADAPTLSVGDAAGDEDGAIALDVSAMLTDAGETLSVTISGVPTGASLSAGTDNGDGTWTLTQGQLSGLTITPPAGSDADFSLTVTATSTDGGDSAQASDTIGVTVAADADAPTLSVDDGTGATDTAISLDVTAGLVDTDGSESLSLTVSGVPTGATLSSGTDNGDGTWTLDSGDLAGLSVTPPAGSSEDFSLTVTATSTESENGDTAQTVATLDVTVIGEAGQTIDGDQNANRNDQLYGGDDDDLIHGYSKNDQVWGGDGDDTLHGDGGNDVLHGEAGDDALYGGTGNDQLFGGTGNDTFSLGAGNDVAQGGDGSDMLTFAEGEGTNNTFHGGGGAWTDTIQLQDAEGGAPGEGWVLDLTQGEQVSSGNGFLELSQDSAGTVTMEDGSVLTFDGVEKLTW